MENKSDLRSLKEATLAGKFDHVCQTIKAWPKQLEEHAAIQFIIACCNACNSNLSTPENLNEDDLVNLLKYLLSCIRTPLKDHCDSYLQSVVFILKLLIKKKSLECIIKLEELLMPEFLPLVFTEKQTVIHTNICTLLYNLTVRISNAREKQHRQSVLKLSFFLTNLYKKARNVKRLLDSLHNCLVNLANLNVDPQSLLDYYTYSLNLLDDIRDPSIYHLLIDSFSCLYAHLLKMAKFDLARTCYHHTTLKLTLHNNKEQRHLSELLQIVDWFNPSNEHENDTPAKAHNTLKNYYRQSKTTDGLKSICDVVSSVAFVMYQHYKTNDCEKWAELSPDVQSELFKLLHDVSHVMSKTPYQCHCKQCSTKTNINEAVRTLESIAGFAHLYISRKSDVSRAYKTDVLWYLEKYTDHVTLLKQNGCPRWSNHWYNAGKHLYTFGLRLQEQKDLDTCALFVRKFVRAYLELEDGESRTPIDATFLTSALTVLSEVHSEVRDHERCLLMVAFALTLDPPGGNRDALMYRWIRAKIASRESSIVDSDGVQELSVVSVCAKHRQELADFYPARTFELEERKQVALLTQELAAYKARWKSKVPMMAAYRDLCRVASSVRCAQVFVEVWGECDLRVHDSLPSLLEATVRKLEVDTRDRRNSQIKFYLAHLYFLQHKYRVKDTIVKHCDEMEKTMSMTSRTEPIEGTISQYDAQDECEIVSSYNSLKLSIYLKMLKQLTKASETIGELFEDDDVRNLSEKRKLYKLLINMSHEYTLHCFVAKSLETLHYALKLARLEENKGHILQTIGFIIEQCDVTKPQIGLLIEEAESYLPSLLESHLEDSILYYLCKAEAFFYSDFHTAYEAYNLASRYSQRVKPNDILKARLYFLHHKFVTLPCEFEVEGHKEFSLVRIHNAHDHAIRHYAENPHDSPYDMKIFFDICEHLLKMYHDLRFPREVRCYGKEMVVIAQKMLLPFRTVTLLRYLSEADALSCRYDEFRVKLSGIADILCLSRSASRRLPFPEHHKVEDRTVERLASEFGEMILDVPARSSTLSGSPIFEQETFDFPVFLSHEPACECFYCVSVEYQQMVLTEVRLRAVFSERTKDLKLAQEFFRGAVRIFECLKRKRDAYSTKLAKRVPSELVPAFWKRFELLYCEILHEYGDFFLRRERVKDAECVNRKARETLEPYHLEAVHLYNEVLVQRLNILVGRMEREKVKKETEPELNTATVMVKTPENKQSTVVISPRPSPEHVEVVKVIPKQLKFDLGDEDEPSTTTTTKKKDNRNLPPFLNMAANAKTPAPSSAKIKIYTEGRSTRKKKVLTDIQLPGKSDQSLDFVVPMSPEAYTPQPVKKKTDGSLLSQRTKVLTEKLRSSNRKKVPSIVISDENSSKEGKEKVRQNLLGQLLEGDEEERKKGAVRRSARNK